MSLVCRAQHALWELLLNSIKSVMSIDQWSKYGLLVVHVMCGCLRIRARHGHSWLSSRAVNMLKAARGVQRHGHGHWEGKSSFEYVGKWQQLHVLYTATAVDNIHKKDAYKSDNTPLLYLCIFPNCHVATMAWAWAVLGSTVWNPSEFR